MNGVKTVRKTGEPIPSTSWFCNGICDEKSKDFLLNDVTFLTCIRVTIWISHSYSSNGQCNRADIRHEVVDECDDYNPLIIIHRKNVQDWA